MVSVGLLWKEHSYSESIWPNKRRNPTFRRCCSHGKGKAKADWSIDMLLAAAKLLVFLPKYKDIASRHAVRFNGHSWWRTIFQPQRWSLRERPEWSGSTVTQITEHKTCKKWLGLGWNPMCVCLAQAAGGDGGGFWGTLLKVLMAQSTREWQESQP